MRTRDEIAHQASSRKATQDRRRETQDTMLALQRTVGNRAVGRLLSRSPFDEVPEGVTAGANALPVGTTVAQPDEAAVVADPTLGGGWTDPGGKTTSSGRVGGIDRVLLEGLSGGQGDRSWGEGAKPREGFAGAAGAGPAGHRGRAVALVPHQTRTGAGGPVSVIIHFHGIDIGKLQGSSGMREQGARPEDVGFFQLPQQLEAFVGSHPGSRVVVLMPLGATVPAGKGFSVDFGVHDVDAYVDECLDKLGLKRDGGTVYLSAHSGGGFTIPGMASGLDRRKSGRYRFGGVFGFESFHGDTETWGALVASHLKNDLDALERLKKELKAAGRSDEDVAAAQLAYLRDTGFRFAAFAGSNVGYTSNLTTLRKVILGWFATQRPRLRDVTGGRADILNQLWRNYQAIHAPEGHMQALSKDSHYESVLESLADVVQPAPRLQRQPAPHPEEHGTVPDPDFKVEHYPSSKHDVEKASELKVLVPKKGHKRAISKAPSEYLLDIVRDAADKAPGKVSDPEHWFDNFTSDLTFLGRRFQQPVHKILAEHLRKVEKELAATHGGPRKDPAVAGRALGLNEDIVGARPYPTAAAISMHMFGLAIDVNYAHNPMVHPGSAGENEVFARAGELIDGREAGADPHRRARNQLTTSMSYADATRLNKLITDYFKLAGDEVALKRKLDAAGGYWTGMPVAKAKERIEADLGEEPISEKEAKKRGVEPTAGGLAYRWERGGSIEMIRTQGFLELKEELVRGLKMNWGGSYGDMMHFDLRDDGGPGQAIHGAINPYLEKLKAEADKPDPPAPTPAAPTTAPPRPAAH